MNLVDLLSERDRGVLVTLKRDGRPQLSNVVHTYRDGLVRISATEDRAKTKNLRRDPRGSFHVTNDDLGAYLVAEGTAEVSPPAAEPGDATVDELIEVYKAIAGEHPDWDEYRAAMVADRRVVIRLRVEYVYGWSAATGPVRGTL